MFKIKALQIKNSISFIHINMLKMNINKLKLRFLGNTWLILSVIPKYLALITLTISLKKYFNPVSKYTYSLSRKQEQITHSSFLTDKGLFLS